MFYDYTALVPANTPETSPMEVELVLAPGIIHRVAVSFPDGAVGLVYVQIFKGFHQVWPTNPDSSFNWNNYTIEWDDYLPLNDIPFELKAKLWNLDDTFAHSIDLRLGVVPEDVYWKIGGPKKVITPIQQGFNLGPIVVPQSGNIT